MKLNTFQQHNAHRREFFCLLPFDPMNRTESRHKTRRAQLAKVRTERFKTNAAMAEKLGEGFSPSFLSQLLSGHRGIGDDVADKIETRLGLPAGYLDHPQDADADEFAWLFRNATDEGRALLTTAMKAVAGMFIKPGAEPELQANEERGPYARDEGTWIIGGPNSEKNKKRRTQ